MPAHFPVAWAQENTADEASNRTIATFDLNADFRDSDEFYNFPYASDLRLVNGQPDFSGFPVFTGFIGFLRR